MHLYFYNNASLISLVHKSVGGAAGDGTEAGTEGGGTATRRLTSSGLQRRLASAFVTDAEAFDIFNSFDEDGSGSLSKAECLKLEKVTLGLTWDENWNKKCKEVGSN